jgi:hypothetical protein
VVYANFPADPPPTYCHIGRNLFRTSPDCWRHKAFDVSSCLQNTRIIAGWRRMGHVHAGSMYWSRCKEAKESLCDSFIVLLSFESGSVMGKISRWYVARYLASTHHEWRQCRWCLERHPITPRGQISINKQRFAQLFRNVVRFVAYKNVACESSIGYIA